MKLPDFIYFGDLIDLIWLRFVIPRTFWGADDRTLRHALVLEKRSVSSYKPSNERFSQPLDPAM